ncbi:MAG TPA: flagellar filament capping protein FliD [Opitutaceae bacterium]|nr:flagellar filament capping protein FliD [Opitutaceae bacterium]
MAGLQLSGLASGFDWKSLVDNLMELERTPITRLQAEKTLNDRKTSALATLNTRLAELKTASQALKDNSLFTGRSAASTQSNSNWLTNASPGAPVGNYTFNVLQLATTTRRAGSNDIGRGIAATNDVSGVTLATLPTATAVTAGKFTVNGQSVDIALSDSLEDVFDKISTATGGAVTASYNSASDKIELSSSSEIVLGAANDTSNFLSVARLANNGSGAVSSGTALGTTSLTSPLANARLRTDITAVDGGGNGTFSINGVSLSYNVTTDSLSTIMGRINASNAGVTATYDSASDRMVLTNKVTGDTGLSISEDTGGLMNALGLSGTSTLDRGKNARFTINGGSELTSTSNTFDAAAHGINGLSITARTATEETISVGANTSSMRSAIDAFVTKFNAVQTYIDEQTKVTSSNGKVTAALMSSNREIQDWARTLRSSAFAAVEGITGSVKRLDDLGIDFTSGSSTLTVKDSTKLEAALLNNAADVESFFTKASSGFSAKLEAFVTNTTGLTGSGGSLGAQTTALGNSSKSIDSQIAAIERQLAQRRSQLEAGFIAMETAQATLQQMQSQLTNAFSSTNSSK